MACLAMPPKLASRRTSDDGTNNTMATKATIKAVAASR